MFKTLKSFYKFVFRYKYRFWIAFFLIALTGFVKNLIPIQIGNIVDSVNASEINKAYSILLILIILMVARTLLLPLGRMFSDNLILHVSKDIWANVFKHIHNLDFAYHANKSSGSLISLFKRGETGVVGIYINLNILSLEILVEFLFLFLFLFNLYPKILLVTLIIVVSTAVFMIYSIRNNVKKRNTANDHQDIVSGITVDNMINFDTVKYFANEEYEQKKLETWLEKYRKAEMKYIHSFRVIELGNGGIINIGILVMIAVALIDLTKGNISIGMFVTVSTFATFIGPRLFDLVYNLREVAKNFADIQKFLGVLDQAVFVKDDPKPLAVQIWKSMEGSKGYSINLENVNFSYEGNKNILKNFNLQIKPGESIALVGHSGAGKTTVAKLLMRLYDPTQGSISINNIDIKDISKSDLRKKIGVVPQETILFNDTIGYNIAYGKENFTLEELDNALKMANLYDFVQSLADKYMTMVGERGIKLSGGQKQRLGIARVFMENAPIIVFDEATSNLDSESERLIQESFWKLAKNRTTIIIAHRLSTIKKVDRIIVIENGEIKEAGTHQELSQKTSGIYSYLWRLQAGDDVE